MTGPLRIVRAQRREYANSYVFLAGSEQEVQLVSAKTTYFEIITAYGLTPRDCCKIFGPKPLDGKDNPPNLRLSFRMLTASPE